MRKTRGNKKMSDTRKLKEFVVVVDFVDSRVPMLKAAFRRRQELYAA